MGAAKQVGDFPGLLLDWGKPLLSPGRVITTGTLETGRRGHHSSLCSEKIAKEETPQETVGPAPGG